MDLSKGRCSELKLIEDREEEEAWKLYKCSLNKIYLKLKGLCVIDSHNVIFKRSHVNTRCCVSLVVAGTFTDEVASQVLGEGHMREPMRELFFS